MAHSNQTCCLCADAIVFIPIQCIEPKLGSISYLDACPPRRLLPVKKPTVSALTEAAIAEKLGALALSIVIQSL